MIAQAEYTMPETMLTDERGFLRAVTEQSPIGINTSERVLVSAYLGGKDSP
jgi:hypothetical protein